jgi:hypothetical protein
MPILRSSLVLSALIALAAPLSAQTNPLAGDTQAPQKAAPVDSYGGLIIPAAERGQLRVDPDHAATGGVVFADELGWYRFKMPDGGTSTFDGTMRQFSFPAGTIPTTCFAVRVEERSLAQFAMPQIQAGKLRALGVTSPRRLAPFPDVPAIADFVLDFLKLSRSGLQPVTAR